MLFLSMYLLAMVLPGVALVKALRLNTCLVAMAISLSLGVLVVALMFARALELDTQGFGHLLVVIYTLSVAGATLAWWPHILGLAPRLPSSFRDGTWIVPTMTLGAVATYVFWAGPYTEVPSDAWHHIERIGDLLDHIIIDESIGSASTIGEYFSEDADYWYAIAAYFLYASGAGLETGLEDLAAANTLLFSAGVYSFALFVFGGLMEDRWMRHWVAAASVFFFLAQFGISVFSYVRYYTLAPTFLNYIVYLAAVACILRFVHLSNGAWRFPVVAVFLVIIAVMVHTQEAVFIVSMSATIILVKFLLSIRSESSGSGFDVVGAMNQVSKRVLMLLGVGVVVYMSIHIWAYIEVTRHDPLKHGVMADIRNYIPFLQNLYILRPEHQFYQVITAWGVLVYILFFAGARHFSESPYLVAGMTMPLLTVFNPVFTDLFLRFSWPEVLWRMCYMIPLPFVGGYFLVRSVATGVRAREVYRRIGHLTIAAALVALLLPIQSTYFVSPYSKIYTLVPVAAANDHRHWRDLLEYLDTRHAASIVTDPVTGYVIKGLTAHSYSGHKFHAVRTLRVDRESYTASDFREERGGLVVINRRNGAGSETGRHGRHWPADIMKVSEHYSAAFRSFVEEQPHLFDLLWKQDRIGVYRIVDREETTRNNTADEGGASVAESEEN